MLIAEKDGQTHFGEKTFSMRTGLYIKKTEMVTMPEVVIHNFPIKKGDIVSYTRWGQTEGAYQPCVGSVRRYGVEYLFDGGLDLGIDTADSCHLYPKWEKKMKADWFIHFDYDAFDQLIKDLRCKNILSHSEWDNDSPYVIDKQDHFLALGDVALRYQEVFGRATKIVLPEPPKGFRFELKKGKTFRGVSYYHLFCYKWRVGEVPTNVHATKLVAV